MRSAHILVVDDDREILNALGRFLTKTGFVCTTVESGSAAAAECARKVPDAILLDLALRDISGFNLFRALRASSRTKAVPIVLMTGRPNADLLKDAGRLAGAFAFMRKPFDLEQVERTLRAAVGSHPDQPDAITSLSTIVNGPGFQIDTASGDLFIDGRIEHLEPKERDVLLILIRRPGRLCSEDSLRRQVWGTVDLPRNTLETRASALRRKLGSLGSRLQNVRGRGYRFVA